MALYLKATCLKRQVASNTRKGISLMMTAMVRVKARKPARRGATLSTLHEIERILRDARGPISLNEIKRRMRAKAVRHETVRMAVDEFARLGFVVEGPRGVAWIVEPSPQPARGKGRRGAPDIEDLAGSLSRFGTLEGWKRDLDLMRGEGD